jgi:hypothetical protein
MATYTFASVPSWAARRNGNLKLVAKQSTADVVASIKPGPSIARSGSREKGTVPRDTGQLVNSQRVEWGPLTTVSWGTEYAMIQHYGGNGITGTFWVTVAADKWPDIVAANVRRVG